MAAAGDAEAVEAWRTESLLAAGYPLPLAEKLARAPDVDLHQAVALLEQGCAPETVVEILL